MLLVEGTKSTFVWPKNDVYFHFGVNSLCIQNKYRLNFSGVLFINLNGSNVIKLMQDINYFRSRKIIIFSTSILLPLALFWLRENPHVLAVFKIGTPVDSIQIGLNSVINNGKMKTYDFDSSIHLTQKEVFLLEHYLEEGKINNSYKHFNCGYKTLYSRKSALARKFGIRKLERLVFND